MKVGAAVSCISCLLVCTQIWTAVVCQASNSTSEVTSNATISPMSTSEPEAPPTSQSEIPSISQSIAPPTTLLPIIVPEVNWQVAELTLSEGEMIKVCFSIDIAAQTYEIKIDGRGKGNQTADFNQDYVIMPTNFSAESEMSYCTSVHIIDDLLAEGKEQFELYFASNSTRIGKNATVCINIEKNNGVEVNFDKASILVVELDSKAEVCLVLNGSIADPVTVIIEIKPNDRLNNAVRLSDSDNTVMFQRSRDSQRLCVDVLIDDNRLGNEPNKTFSVIIKNISNPVIMIGIKNESSVTIIDDDKPEIKWNITDSEVSIYEGENTSFCFSSKIASAIPYQVEVGVRSKTANAEDYKTLSPLTFNVSANISGEQFCVNISIVDDLIFEETEQFELYFVKHTSATTDNPDTIYVNILDNDAVQIGFNNMTYTGSEGDEVISVTVAILNGTLSQELVVLIGILTKEDTAKSLSDYEPVNGTLTFNNERVSYVINVTIEDDEVDEENERLFVVLQLESELPKVQLAPNYTTLTIQDNDRITIGMDLPNDTVIESHGRVQVCATLTDGTLERTVYVNLSTRNNNATSADPVDFSAVAVELQFNETTSRACADIPITDDNRVELPEIFTVEISSGDPDVDFKPSTATVTILDNDMVMIGFEMERYQGEEGENVGVCVLLSGTLERSVVVEIITGDISIEGSLDYTPTTAELTFNSDRSRECVSIRLVNDSLLEPTEDFEVSLTTDEEQVILNPERALIFILDVDGISIGFELQRYTVNEDDGSIEVCAVLTGGSLEKTVTFTLSTRDNNSATSTDPIDFSAVDVELQFNETTSRACADIPITDDNRVELPENFTVEIHSDDPDVDFAPPTSVVTILDNDRVVIGFEMEQYRGEEGGMVEVCAVVSLNGSLDTNVSVQILTEDLSAEEPGDYQAVDSELVFGVDSRRQCVSISLENDGILEDTEKLQVSLASGETAVMLDPKKAFVSILDTNVATIGFQPETYRDREASEVINVTVAVLTGTLSREVVVRIYSIDSSAKSPNDYKSFNETLTFDSEKTMLVFPVRIINDGVDEEDEQLLSRLQLEPVEGDSPNVRIQVQPNVTTLTIVDDDEIPIGFEHSRYTVNEGDGSIEVCASSGLLEGTVIFTISSRDNSATSPADFSAVSIELQFNKTTSKACTDIPITDDSIIESQENFTLMMTSNDIGVIINMSEVLTITISDDDKVMIEFERGKYQVEEGRTVEVCAVLKNATLERNLTIRLRDRANKDSELTFNHKTRKNCTEVVYNRLDEFKTFSLSLVSDDEAAILSASQAEITVIPQHVFTQEDVLLEVLLRGLTVETFNETKQRQFQETTADIVNSYCEDSQCQSFNVEGQRKRQAVNRLQVTADDIVIRNTKTIEQNKLQITMLIISSGRVVSATVVGNAVQTHSDRFAQAGFTIIAERIQVVTFVTMETSQGLSPGAIIGIVIAALFLVVISIVIIVLIIHKLRCRKTKGSGQRSGGSNSKDSETVYMTAIAGQQQRSNIYVETGKRGGEGDNENEMTERGGNTESQ